MAKAALPFKPPGWLIAGVCSMAHIDKIPLMPSALMPHESGHGITGTDEILLKGDPSTTFVL
jgi:hypothetical protein